MRKKVKLSDKCGKSKIVGQLSKKKDGLLIKDRIVNLGKKELMQSTNLINENTTIYIFEPARKTPALILSFHIVHILRFRFDLGSFDQGGLAGRYPSVFIQIKLINRNHESRITRLNEIGNTCKYKKSSPYVQIRLSNCEINYEWGCKPNHKIGNRRTCQVNSISGSETAYLGLNGLEYQSSSCQIYSPALLQACLCFLLILFIVSETNSPPLSRTSSLIRIAAFPPEGLWQQNGDNSDNFDNLDNLDNSDNCEIGMIKCHPLLESYHP